MMQTPAADIVAELLVASRECSGHEPSLSVLQRAADRGATEIEAHRAREADLQRKLDEVVKTLERVAGSDWVDDQNRLSDGKDISLRREMRAQQAMAAATLASIRGETV